MYSRKLTIFLFFILTIISSKSFAQFYLQPQIGIIFTKSKIDNNTNVAKTQGDEPYFGLIVGKKQNKIEHQLGYFFYPIGISYAIATPYAGWGTKYMVTHNISYAINYNILHWKRLDIKAAGTVHLCLSRLTWPSARHSGRGSIIYVNNPVYQEYDAIGYERAQLMIEPHLDIDIRLFKRITWNTHFGYIFGNKNIYTMESRYTIKGVSQPNGYSKVDGTAEVFSTGFKFYFKQKKPKE